MKSGFAFGLCKAIPTFRTYFLCENEKIMKIDVGDISQAASILVNRAFVSRSELRTLSSPAAVL
jgi:hypothetical protein